MCLSLMRNKILYTRAGVRAWGEMLRLSLETNLSNKSNKIKFISPVFIFINMYS